MYIMGIEIGGPFHATYMYVCGYSDHPCDAVTSLRQSGQEVTHVEQCWSGCTDNRNTVTPLGVQMCRT